MQEKRICLYIKAEFWVAAAMLTIILPFWLVVSWFVAALIHELSHYIILRICKVDIHSITLGMFGAVINTAPMNEAKEMVCALAGPIGGLGLIVFVDRIPYIALIGFLQSLFNLLPFDALDGGRVLSCLVRCLCPKYADAICFSVRFLVGVGIIIITIRYMFTIPVLVLVGFILLIKFVPIKIPCKRC